MLDDDRFFGLERLHGERGARLVGVELLNRSSLASYDLGPCLRFPRQAQFHPLKYLSGLAWAVERQGGCIARVPRGAVHRALYWDTADPCHYVWLQGFGEGKGADDVLIVGGEDHKAGQVNDADTSTLPPPTPAAG